MHWIPCVTCLGSSRTLVTVVMSASYAYEVLPLLPFRRREFPAFVVGLQRFAPSKTLSCCFNYMLEFAAECERAAKRRRNEPQIAASIVRKS
ncbi:hypothetical protein GQ600_3050 [Phytophthora cactorum]|nr:hypothetical protein GQ600_3050 [Phytophthora cactorum]